jgi:chromosome segregation ATPase
MAKKSPSRKSPAKKKTPRKPPRASRSDVDERLLQAMEELQAAHEELSRLGHLVTAAHREIDDHKHNQRSAESNLRAEVAALRTDLKTALAELEISRQEVERLRKKIAGGLTLPGLG